MADYDQDGSLGSPAEQRAQQQAAKKARDQLRRDMFELRESMAFKRWLGRYVIPLLITDMKTTNGGDLQHYIGRRSLALAMMNEVDEFQPGFLGEMLEARAVFEKDLRKPPEE